MVARVFTNIAHFEIRVSWIDKTRGYVNGLRFTIENEEVTFPGHPTFHSSPSKKASSNLYRSLIIAVRRTPEFQESKRESKSNFIKVIKLSGERYEVRNSLNPNSVYEVVTNSSYTCSCPDHTFRKVECKHIKAVKRDVNKPTTPLMTVYNGKALNPRLRVVSDLTESQITTAKASLGWQ